MSATAEKRLRILFEYDKRALDKRRLSEFSDVFI